MSKNILKIILSDPSLCQKWEANKLVNPITGRKIKENGPTYNKLMKQCNRLKLGKVKPKPLQPSPKKTKERRKRREKNRYTSKNG